MKKQLRFIFLLLILAGFSDSRLAAQTFGSEAELKTQAAKLFDNDQFEEAYPLYAQLTSLYNKDATYNYRLGVCMLYANEDKEKPIQFLELAAKYPDVEKEVFLYLAKAYHLNYRFDDAIKQYQAYQNVASGPKEEKLQVAHQIEMCRNGKKLLRNLTDLIVIDKKEMNRTDFFRSYDISEIGGKLLAKPDDGTFKTSIDKKKKESSIIYFSSDNNQIYFSSYGDDLAHGKDIYLIRKLPNGELSKPQTLGYPVNTAYDEDFPFLHPNGKVLYFCSKGHNSMGGYDIFKTTLNEATNTWSKPVNLDFPINSPDDDILYVTNANEKEAFFSSARSSATGKIAVYHINVERKPMDVVIISGTITSTSPDKNVKITVKDLDNNVVLGIFNSTPTGNFEMNLPSGAKVMYTVESPGLPTQSEVVTIPSQTALAALKQEISFEQGTGKLNVKNFFEETGGENNYLSAINLIKEKSKMDVNVQDITVDNPSKTTADQETGKTKPLKYENKPANLSNEEIVKIAYADAKDVAKEAKELKGQADIALLIANQKNEEGQNKAREAAALAADAAELTDQIKKQPLEEQLNNINKELKDINQLTVATFNIAKVLEMKADAKQKEADLSLQYAKDLEAAVKLKNSTEALAKLEEQQKKLDAISQKNEASTTISNSLKLDADNKKRELDKAIQTSADIKQELIDTESAIASTEADAAKEKNENIRQGLQNQIQGLRQDILNSKKELENNEIKVNQLQKDYDGINNQIELFNSVVDKAKTGNNETVAASVATIDKTKLEQQVNKLKTSDTIAPIKPVSLSNPVEPKTTVIVQNNGTQTNLPVTEQEKVTTDHTPPVTETSVMEVPILNDDRAFEKTLAAMDTISDKTEKERKKAEVYEAWSTALNKEIIIKKSQSEKEKNTEKKHELARTIASLEKELVVVTQSQKETNTALENLKKEQPEVVTTGRDMTTTPPDDGTVITSPIKTEDPFITTQTDKQDQSKQLARFEQVYQQEMTDAEKAPTVPERESKKLRAAKNYVNAVTLVLNEKKSDLDSENDQANQQRLNQEITMLEQRIAEKQKVADTSDSKIAALTIPPVKNSVERNESFAYTNPIANDHLTKATAIDKEAEALLAGSKKLKQDAVLQVEVAEKNTLYARAEELTASAASKKVEAAQLVGMANTIEYKNNQHLLDQYVSATTGSSDESSIASLMKDEAGVYFEKAQNSRKVAAALATPYAKQTALEDAYRNELIALQKQSSALSIYKKNNPKLNIKSLTIREPSITFDAKPKETTVPPIADEAVTIKPKEPAPEEEKKSIVVKTEQPFIPTNTAVEKNKKDSIQPSIITDQPVAEKTVIPIKPKEEVTGVPQPVKESTPSNAKFPLKELFERKSSSVYSSANPIPIDEKLPDGLIFKVQLGAFKNQIPQDLFKGISPLSGETTAKGFIRYTAGLFLSCESAARAKNEIKAAGFPDAFVVAFFDGKRIPSPCGDEGTVATTIPKDNTDVVVPPSADPTVINSTEMAVSKDMTSLSGLLYTIQVGVYTNPVTDAQLNNIQPLYTEKIGSLIRYNVGIYNNIPLATEAKKIAMKAGLTDAFLIVYYNGKRISMVEAATLTAQGITPAPSVPGMNLLPTFKNPAAQKNPQSPAIDIVTPVKSGSVQLPETEPGIVFKVQIGAFYEEVPLEIANKFLKISKKGIKNYKDETGLTIYTVGKWTTYAEADQLRQEVVKEGLEDAFVVAYSDGKKIPVDEAQKLIGNK